ncbi:hypothetical protein BLJAPNOD_00840 [Ensifer sp. M14]|uniref:Shedu immune nuclease family protein n=1 Tax=Ensifer sp. M14 TaxID=2203782 RepID=UPI000E1DDDD8|nr:Shedu immune nuclease family protein [Ensifer sp. M14]RDL49732.1 hypothetical protein BLJAPNOD_00840 [Ensifer sp. M14]
MNEDGEYKLFLNMYPEKTYVSKSFRSHEGERMRIANKVIDGEGGFEFATVNNEEVLRETRKGRFQIKAAFIESDRSFQSVTIQRFVDNGTKKEAFSLQPSEVTRLLSFLSNIRRLHFPNDGKINISDADLEDLLLQPAQAKRLLNANLDMVAALLRTEVTNEDVIALGYRKRQLRTFQSLLTDEDYFAKALSKAPAGAESVWQQFFEKNAWIFGYGLSMIFFGSLDGRKLEQTVRGYDITGSGKRVDALLKSHALLSTACFVEIKRHDTPLMYEAQYRSGAWQPSDHLTGAVAQSQVTVASALENWRTKERFDRADGEPGDTVYTTEPRSFVIAGQLAEFQSESGVNDRKFRSFELYRRNLVRPEIITFDELYQRASLIVEAQSAEN